jgi:hypothetical protein
MAKTSPLSLYADTEEGQQRVQDYKDAQENLRQALSARENQAFDPMLLAISQALASPTKTGSFGEVIGNVAGAIGTSQEGEQKRARELAGMRMELAQQGLQTYQTTAGDKVFREMMSRGRPGAAQPSAAQPGAAPPAASTLGGTAPTSGAPAVSAPQGRVITSQDIARLASMPGMAEKAKILQDMVTSDRERFKISMNGIVFDQDTQKYLNLEIPGQKQEPFTTTYGTFNMTPYEYSQYKLADSEGRGKEFIDVFRGATPAAPPPVAVDGAAPPAPAGAKPQLRPTVQQQEAEAAAAKTKGTKTAEAEVGRTQEAIEAGKDATGRMASYSALRSIASRPDAKEIFGIFNRPDFGTALLNLVQEGVQSPGSTSIRAGALEDTLRNLGLPQDQIDRYRFGLSIMANIQLQQAKLAAGQGAISNFERGLFGDATLSPKDNPQTILSKLSMMEARADFDRKRASALRTSKMDADEFMDTPQGQRMAQDYLNKIAGIAGSFGVSRPAPKTQSPAAGNYGPAGRRLREELGVR